MQIHAKYNKNVMNRLSTVNSSVRSVWYRRVCAKIWKNKDRWLLNGPWTFRPTFVRLATSHQRFSKKLGLYKFKSSRICGYIQGTVSWLILGDGHGFQSYKWTPVTELPQYLGQAVPELGCIKEGVLHCCCSAVWDEELYSVPSGGWYHRGQIVPHWNAQQPMDCSVHHRHLCHGMVLY